MIEIEFKWTVSSKKDFRHFLREMSALPVKINSPAHHTIRDLYFDTKSGFFRKQKTHYRLRQMNGRFEITVKSKSRSMQGLVKRQEKTIPLKYARSEREAVACLAKRLLRGKLKDQTLMALFAVTNQRRVRTLRFPDGTAAELSFDDVKLSRYRKTFRMREIELEFLQGRIKTFESFTRAMTQKTGLKAAHISKVATAMQKFRIDSLLKRRPRPKRSSKRSRKTARK